MTEGAKAFELYGNLLSDKALPAWEKIIQAQVTSSPWEDIYGVTDNKTPTKTWDSFMDSVMFHLQQVFKTDAGKPSSTTSPINWGSPTGGLNSSVFGQSRAAEQLPRESNLSVFQHKCESGYQDG